MCSSWCWRFAEGRCDANDLFPLMSGEEENHLHVVSPDTFCEQLRSLDTVDGLKLTSVKCIKPNPLCWCQPPPPRTHVVREYRGHKCVVHVAYSHPKRTHESHGSKLLSTCPVPDTPYNEPSLRVVRHS